jgi:hypothetical protein
MNIYYGKNKLKAKRITLKALIEEAININDDSVEVISGRLEDGSDSYIEFKKETSKLNNGVRVDVYISFNPENDFDIREIELYMSNKLFGYDEENMRKL